MIRRAAMLMTMAALAAACSKRQPPPPPVAQTEPVREVSTPTTDDDAARRAAEEAARAAEAERARLRAVLEEMVNFDYDESVLRADAQQVLQRKIPILRANAGVALRIVGHADERGSVEYNLALGLRRANSVREYLAGFGIDASRIETDTMGEDRPLDAGANESAWARNRRAEFAITRGGENLTSGR